MVPLVPPVANFFPRAPPSLMFCGVRNTQKYKYLAFADFTRHLFVQRTHIHNSAHSAGRWLLRDMTFYLFKCECECECELRVRVRVGC